MSAIPASTSETQWLRRFGWRGLQAAGIGVAVALCLALLGGRLASTLVYSVCIALGCWFFIDSGRMLVARWVVRPPAGQRARTEASQWPGWGWMALVLPLGTLAGYALGNAAAAWLLGDDGLSIEQLTPHTFGSILLLSLLPGIAATYFFQSRGRLAASRAQAEQAERMAAEQRLRLLASQLEPHMLFNTLANLRVLIGIDPARAQAMLDRLIPFLRATLDASRASTHPLATEFARLGDYLELMQIRMGPRLQTRCLLPEALAARPVPALLLQPLVENAIKHGLEPHIAGGRIDISAAHEGTELVLRVRDTGAGLDATQGAHGGFGLEQVRERLATLYGAAAGITIAPAADAEGGTLVTLRLPW